MEVFHISQPGIIAGIGYAFIILGIAFFVVGIVLVLIKRHKTVNIKKGTIPALIIAGLVISFTAVIVTPFGSGSQNSITIGDHYIMVSGQYIGNQNFTSGNIKYAFIENINSGNITLSTRNAGTTSIGNYNEGRFTTNNGTTAYVITDNQTVLVVLTNSNIYLIIGSNNTESMAHYFSKEVFPVNFS